MARPQGPLLWIAASKRDYKDFPARIQDGFGFELFLVQTGQHPPSAKSLSGMGGGTLELIENFDGDTYRIVYGVRFSEAVYVLHAFKKKSKRGSKTPQADIDVIKRRLQAAKEDYAQRFVEDSKR